MIYAVVFSGLDDKFRRRVARDLKHRRFINKIMSYEDYGYDSKTKFINSRIKLRPILRKYPSHTFS